MSDESDDTSEIIDSRIDGILEKVERLERRLNENEETIQEEIESIKQRLKIIENDKEQVPGSDETTSRALGESCVLEKLCAIPKENRKEHIGNISLYRATLIWENYNEWSDKITKGKILKSSDIKKLLKTLSDDEIQWSQVYRSMEKFNENSPDQYVYIKEENIDKALLRKKNKDMVIKINGNEY